MSNIEVDPDAPVTHRYFAEYLAKAQADRDILLVLIQENTRAARENREAFEAFKKAEEEEMARILEEERLAALEGSEEYN